MELYEALKSRKGLPVSDSTALLFGRQTGGGGGSDVEYFGAVPFEISAKGTQNAKEYTIYGTKPTQSSVPTDDVPVKILGVGERTANLFDSKKVNILNGFFSITYNRITRTSADIIIYVPCEPNTKYTIKRNILPYPLSTSRFSIGFTDKQPDYNAVVTNITQKPDGTDVSTITVNSDENSKYICIFFMTASCTNKEEVFNNLQINVGETALPYEPYGYKIPVVSEGKNLWNPDGRVTNQSGAPAYGVRCQAGRYKLINNSTAYIYCRDGYDSTSVLKSVKPSDEITLSFSDECVVWCPSYQTKIKVVNADREPITTTIYTDRPLYSGDYVKLTAQGGIIHREWGWKILDGNTYITEYNTDGFAVRENFENVFNYTESVWNGPPKIHIHNSNACYFRGTNATLGVSTVDEYHELFQRRYNEGNPFIICYQLAVPEEETIDLPNLQLADGYNSIDVDTQVKPESMQIKFKGDVLSQQASLMMLNESTEDTNEFEESEEMI